MKERAWVSNSLNMCGESAGRRMAYGIALEDEWLTGYLPMGDHEEEWLR